VIPRRNILHALCAGLLAIPLSGRGNGPGLRRIGFFYGGSRESAWSTVATRFPAGNARARYIEGKDFFIEARSAPTSSV